MLKYLSLIVLLLASGFSANAQYSKKAIQMYRDAYMEALHKEERAPLNQADIKNVHFYAPARKFVVQADVKILSDERSFNMPTYDGTSKQFIRYAIARFKIGKQQHELTLYRNLSLNTNPLYDQHLFLPFTDKTNGKYTYGGGRYIDLQRASIQDGKMIIDFNKAYNPYCAFSDGYRCPVPPQENDLQIDIAAGEKNYKGKKKKVPKEQA